MMMTVSGLEAMIYNDFSSVLDIIGYSGGKLCWNTQLAKPKTFKKVFSN